MKKIILGTILLSVLTSCSSYVRIGDLTGISNRNIDDSKKYVLIKRDVESIAKADSDALEQAVDNITRDYQGEFLRNAKIFVKDDGKKIKLIADVWGIQNTNVNITTSANLKIELKVGDKVVFKKKGFLGNSIVKGKIVGLNPKSVFVEYGNNNRIELNYDEVTKSE